DRDLFEAMGRLSTHRASVTTFTAAGSVRRDLGAAGFEVRRVDQQPHKRHSTAGVYTGNGRTFAVPDDTVILGAGLAGTATARALGEKGITAIVMDSSEGIAQGASSIPAAVMHPRLSPGTSTPSSFRLHAFA
ncbi:MAG: FAD-dependent oxidoreductase, partial [Pseudomonadales bacterium]|nr:FAD-dependent oxidoreductase [Pseudomonadales bacterium]